MIKDAGDGRTTACRSRGDGGNSHAEVWRQVKATFAAAAAVWRSTVNFQVNTRWNNEEVGGYGGGGVVGSLFDFCGMHVQWHLG